MRYAILLGPVLGLLALACGGGGGEEVEPTPTPSPAVAQPSPTPEATPTATPTPEPAVQRIAYIGLPNPNLWIMNADGSGQTRLTDIYAFAPHWSPDGSRVAFYFCEPPIPPDFGPCTDRIYVMNADGSGLTLLTEDIPATDVAWSPSGDTFAVTRLPPLGLIDILVLDLEGNTVMELPDGMEPSFSADGRRLAFFEVIGPGGIYPDVRGMVAGLQTSEVQPIDPDEDPREAGRNGPPIFSPTNSSLLAYGNRLIDLNTGQERLLPGRAVSWSPDGQRVLLETCPQAQVYDIQRGSSVLEFDISLRGISASCWFLMRDQSAWSPDSRFLATYDVPAGADALGVLHLRDIDTGDHKTVSVDFPHSLQFSPDSRLLLFLGTDGIWVVGSDGTNLTLLAEGGSPTWQPQP